MPDNDTGAESPLKDDGSFLGYQLVIVVVSVVSLGIMAALATRSLSTETRSILDVADLVVCCLFLVDFVVNVVTSKNRLRYLMTWGWLDLLSAIPTIDVARWGRAARLLRLLRILRVIRAARIMAALAFQHRAQNTAMATALLLVTIIFASSIAILHFEDVDGGNIRNGYDAMWWAVTTVSTVGYGDLYPVTWEGRLIAVLLMIAGVGAFGTIAAGLASWFIQPADHSEVARLAEEVRHLRSVVEQALERTGRESSVSTARPDPVTE
jgi:voltage-gated potassium channel